MTALGDMLAKADQVLALDEKATPGPWEATGLLSGSDDNLVVTGYAPLPGDTCSIADTYESRLPNEDAHIIASYRTAAPDLARALKAVAEVLNVDGPTTFEAVRAAIERRLVKP